MSEYAEAPPAPKIDVLADKQRMARHVIFSTPSPDASNLKQLVEIYTRNGLSLAMAQKQEAFTTLSHGNAAKADPLALEAKITTYERALDFLIRQETSNQRANNQSFLDVCSELATDHLLEISRPLLQSDTKEVVTYGAREVVFRLLRLTPFREATRRVLEKQISVEDHLLAKLDVFIGQATSLRRTTAEFEQIAGRGKVLVKGKKNTLPMVSTLDSIKDKFVQDMQNSYSGWSRLQRDNFNEKAPNLRVALKPTPAMQ